jgi:hypothetical protein
MRFWLWLGALAVVATGCRHWVASSDRAISTKEMARLEHRAVPAERIGVKLAGTSVSWQEKADAPGHVQVLLLPSDQHFSSQPIVDVRINGGLRLPVVLDTGSPVNLIHASVALDNHVSIANPGELKNSFQGLAGSETAYYGMIDRLALGEARFDHVFTAIRTRLHEKKLAGLLPVYRWEGNTIGMTTLFRLKYMTLDYPGGLVSFSAKQPFGGPRNAGSTQVPFEFSQMQITAAIALGETDSIQAVVDTGCEAGIMLPKKLVESLGFDGLAKKGKPEKYASLGGETTVRSFRIPQIRLGGEVFLRVHAIEAPDSYPATLGSGFLKDYRFTIDFQKKVLWLEGRKKG